MITSSELDIGFAVQEHEQGHVRDYVVNRVLVLCDEGDAFALFVFSFFGVSPPVLVD